MEFAMDRLFVAENTDWVYSGQAAPPSHSPLEVPLKSLSRGTFKNSNQGCHENRVLWTVVGHMSSNDNQEAIMHEFMPNYSLNGMHQSSFSN